MNNRKEREIELHSQEVHEILTRPPRALVRWGITVFFVVIVLLFAGGCFFRYPDTLEAEVIITTENPPVWIIARSTGKLKEIYLSDRHEVKQGELIATIENPAETEEVIRLKRQLAAFTPTDSCICQAHFADNRALGPVQSSYSFFVKSLQTYRDFLLLDLYGEREEATRKELKEYRNYIAHLNRQANLNAAEIELAQKMHDREKTLFSRGIISEADFENVQQNFLSRRQNAEQLQVTLSSARIQEAKLSQALIELSLERNREANQLLTSVRTSYDDLLVDISNWELSFLFTAPADGILSYNDVWQKNQHLNLGDKAFSVVATQPGEIIGKVKLPSMGSGKVAAGQRVNIHVKGYPHMEYGYLTGEVAAISLLSNEEYYTVTVKLPQDMRTSYRKQLSFNGELSGIAEIITDERSLTMRLLSPLRYLWEKNIY